MGINFTDALKKRICCWVTNPRKGITIAWLVSLVLVLIAFIVVCIAASKLQQNSNSGGNSAGFGRAAGFAGVWTCLLLIVISILGTIIMRRYQTALAIGFFLGVVFVMTQQMLILFAIFAESAQVPGQSKADLQSQEAMAVFSFFLFIVYLFFGGMLGVFREDIIKQEVMSDEPTDHYAVAEEDNMPPQEKDLE